MTLDKVLFRLGLTMGEASRHLTEEEMKQMRKVLLNHIPREEIAEHYYAGMMKQVASSIFKPTQE